MNKDTFNKKEFILDYGFENKFLGFILEKITRTSSRNQLLN